MREVDQWLARVRDLEEQVADKQREWTAVRARLAQVRANFNAISAAIEAGRDDEDNTLAGRLKDELVESADLMDQLTSIGLVAAEKELAQARADLQSAIDDEPTMKAAGEMKMTDDAIDVSTDGMLRLALEMLDFGRYNIMDLLVAYCRGEGIVDMTTEEELRRTAMACVDAVRNAGKSAPGAHSVYR